MLLASALMLVVAACDANGDDEEADNGTEDTTTQPADEETTEDPAGEEDVVVPEDDEESSTEAEGDDVAEDPADDAAESEDDAAETEEDMNGAESEDGEDTDENGDVAVEGEDGAEPGDEEAVDPEEMEPDPNQGMFFDLSVEEANEMTTFEVREPAEVPESLEFQTIMGMASMEASEEELEDEAATITFAYQQPPDEEMMQGLPVEFMQSTEIDMSEGLGPDAEEEQVTIGDREVTRITMMAETGDEIVAYVWNEDEVHFSLAAILGGELEEADLEAMIESVPAA
jgi:hypothetical protein